MQKERIRISTPITDEAIAPLEAGDRVALTGVMYTARDAAHKRLVEMLERGEPMPFGFLGTAVYYAGPSPARPGFAVGSIGPTTSGRMDAYSPILMEHGLKVMIGKGLRNAEVHRAIVRCGGLYLAAVGGAAALLSRTVRSAELVAFPDLGTEAIRRLEVEDFPAIVAIDSRGRDIYERSG
ncbi:MAG: FumA C-terminus/TtdB family hydratase beta subunit [Synergistaceae bacterium]|jgi:fumarate hydratase subunit beta|nr:FumA C-terminus/TtdB family hydratase beta subunit [Synergistaceae bacterium]